MNPPPDSPDNGVLLYRMKVIEDAQREFRSEVNDRLDKLQGSMANLTFVRQDIYDRDRAASTAYAEETRQIALGARSASVAILMSLAGLLLAAGIGIVVRLAG